MQDIVSIGGPPIVHIYISIQYLYMSVNAFYCILEREIRSTDANKLHQEYITCLDNITCLESHVTMTVWLL